MRNTTRQSRENRTITVDFQHEATYVQLLSDGKAFVERIDIPNFLCQFAWPGHTPQDGIG